MIKKTAKTQPFLAAIIIRGLYVVDGIKDYTLIVLDLPFSYYFSSSFIINTFYVLKNVLIGYQLKAISDLLTQKKQWSEIDFFEKCFFAAIFCLVTFSFLATGYITYWAQNQMRGNYFLNQTLII